MAECLTNKLVSFLSSVSGAGSSRSGGSVSLGRGPSGGPSPPGPRSPQSGPDASKKSNHEAVTRRLCSACRNRSLKQTKQAFIHTGSQSQSGIPATLTRVGTLTNTLTRPKNNTAQAAIGIGSDSIDAPQTIPPDPPHLPLSLSRISQSHTQQHTTQPGPNNQAGDHRRASPK